MSPSGTSLGGAKSSAPSDEPTIATEPPVGEDAAMAGRLVWIGLAVLVLLIGLTVWLASRT